MNLNPTLPALVVDDFSSVSSITARILRALGFHHVDTAQTGEEALGMVRDKSYGLIVSDLHMKPVSGLDLLRRIKADRLTSAVPVVILTGDPLASAAESAKRAGAFAVLGKAPSPGELREKLARLFA